MVLANTEQRHVNRDARLGHLLRLEFDWTDRCSSLFSTSYRCYKRERTKTEREHQRLVHATEQGK